MTNLSCAVSDCGGNASLGESRVVVRRKRGCRRCVNEEAGQQQSSSRQMRSVRRMSGTGRSIANLDVSAGRWMGVKAV